MVAALAFATGAPAPIGARASSDAHTAPCERARIFRSDAAELTSLTDDPANTAAAVVRRSAVLETIAGPASPLARVSRCASEAPAAYLTAISHANLLRLWARVVALRAVDAPVYPAPYVAACASYDRVSLAYDAEAAWVDRDDARDTGSTRAERWQALASDPLYPRVASLAASRLRALHVDVLPDFDTDENAWLAEAAVRRDFAASTLPSAEHCGPMYALFAVEPETAPFAAYRPDTTKPRLTADLHP